MAGPRRRLERARKDALRLARDARRLAARHRRRLGAVRGEVDAAAEEVVAAAREAGGAPERLEAARARLEALWAGHLAARVKPWWREHAESVLLAVILALLARGFVLDAFRIPSGSMAPTLRVGDYIFVSKIAYAVRVPFTHLRLLETGAPRRGDVIVFENPLDPSSDYVKRVVGIPGDVIELRDQVLFVNGVPQPRAAEGEYAYGDGPAADGAATPPGICHLYREELARGPLGLGEGTSRAAAVESWRLAAAGGVARYEVLQCRHPGLTSREGPFEAVRPGHVFVMGDNRDLSADSRGMGGWQVPFGNIRGRATLVFWSWGAGGAWPQGAGGIRIERLFKPID